MKVRKLSLTLQILIINIVILLVSTIVLGTTLTVMSENTMVILVKQRMIDIANAAAASLDGDVLEALEDGDQETDPYLDALNTLGIFRDHTDLEYIYCMEQTGNESFIFTVDADPEEPADWGDPVEVTEALLIAGAGTAAVDDKPYSDEWGNHYSAYSPVRNSSGKVAGVVGVDFSAEWYDTQVAHLVRTVILLSVVLLAFSILAILLLTARIKKGFRALNDKLSDLADGSGDLTKKIEISSGDEFEIISGNMNTFVEQIREIVSGVKENVSDSISASGELSEVAERGSRTMGGLSEAISRVSAGALQQSEDVTTASGNVRMIVDRLGEMTKTVNEAEKNTNRMSDNSSLVAGSFDELIASIQDSMKELEQVTREMSGVGSYVEQVTEAADAINAIATQTNLLSLNASIEAARAGDAGRGFAVVADEIGKLAVQSNESSASIKSMMDELKTQTEKTIQLVTKLNDVMSRQEATSTGSKESLSTLFDQIERTREDFWIIRENVDGISEACNQLDGTIGSLSSISAENADSAETTAQACEEIAGIVGSVSEKAETIKTHSDDLGNMVGKYRV